MIDYSRCVDCFDCLDGCKQKAISFAPDMHKNSGIKEIENITDKTKREFLFVGLVAAFIMPKVLLAQGKMAILTHGKAYKKKTSG